MPGRPAPLVVRFWRYVDTSAGLFGCWPWRGARTVGRPGSAHPYGAIRGEGDGKPVLRAHRVALILATGEDPGPQWEACHDIRCTTTLCCNPAHLRWGDRLENTQDIIRRAALAATGDHDAV